MPDEARVRASVVDLQPRTGCLQVTALDGVEPHGERLRAKLAVGVSLRRDVLGLQAFQGDEILEGLANDRVVRNLLLGAVDPELRVDGGFERDLERLVSLLHRRAFLLFSMGLMRTTVCHHSGSSVSIQSMVSLWICLSLAQSSAPGFSFL